MDDQERKRKFAAEGGTGETEAVNAPFHDAPPPTGSKAQPAAWLIPLAIVVLLMLGFLVAWGFGMLDTGGA